MPFPDPEPPDEGYKILANVWFPRRALSFGAVAPFRFWQLLYMPIASAIFRARRLRSSIGSWPTISHPAIPRTDPEANGAWYTEWLMVEQPEQSRYTADLTIFWQDLTKTEDNYVFVPALRRSLRLSPLRDARRCWAVT